MKKKEEVLTTDQAAAHRGVGRKQILQMIRKGQLPAERFGHQWAIKASDLDAVTIQRRDGSGRAREKKRRGESG